MYTYVLCLGLVCNVEISGWSRCPQMETQVAKCNHLVMRLSEAQKVCDLVGGENQELQKQVSSP